MSNVCDEPSQPVLVRPGSNLSKRQIKGYELEVYIKFWNWLYNSRAKFSVWYLDWIKNYSASRRDGLLHHFHTFFCISKKIWLFHLIESHKTYQNHYSSPWKEFFTWYWIYFFGKIYRLSSYFFWRTGRDGLSMTAWGHTIASLVIFFLLSENPKSI